MSCITCKFYVVTDIGQGECHRNPPTLIIMPGAQMSGLQSFPKLASMFTPTKSDSWCGEYAKKVTLEAVKG